MPSREVNIGLGTKYIGNTHVTVVPNFEQTRSSLSQATDTARHEIGHATVAIRTNTEVESATVIPDPHTKSRGHTKLRRFNPAAAAAPDADGLGGTSYDIFLIKRFGFNPSSMRSIAKGILDNERDGMQEAALLLDQKKTLSGTEIKNVLDGVKKRKKEPNTAIVYIKNFKGTEKKIKKPINSEGTVTLSGDLIQGEWTTIPGKKAAAA